MHIAYILSVTTNYVECGRMCVWSCRLFDEIAGRHVCSLLSNNFPAWASAWNAMVARHFSTSTKINNEKAFCLWNMFFLFFFRLVCMYRGDFGKWRWLQTWFCCDDDDNDDNRVWAMARTHNPSGFCSEEKQCAIILNANGDRTVCLDLMRINAMPF